MVEPPVAKREPFEMQNHGETRVDDWYWLRDRDNSEVIKFLESENAFTAEVMRDTENLQKELFEEIKARIQETDLSVPVKKGDWLYYHRTEESKQYAIHCRKPVGEETETVMLDENVEAGDAEFFSMGAFDVDPTGNFLAFSIDTSGDETFTTYFRDLRTGKNLDDVIENTNYSSAWNIDGTVFFYTREDETKRPYQVWRHEIGKTDDQLVFQDDDERFFIGVGNSKTEDFIVITAGSSLTSETLFIRSDKPFDEFQAIEPRVQGIEYHVSHHRGTTGDVFYILSNENAPNFKLLKTEVNNCGKSNWQPVIDHRDDVKLDGVESFAKHLILSERAEGNARIAILDLETNELRVLEQDEPVYTAYASGNAEFETSILRFGYTSLVTPSSVYEQDLNTGKRTLLKQQPVLGDFDATQYTSERLWATATDGTRVPISIVYRKDRPKNGGPTLLYGYGSYEITVDPGFSSLRLSLLDRGFAFAIAHIRGGGDLGRLWYENGKFLKKQNTFTDFIACAEHLIDQGFTTSSNLVARGGSAGGLLMGAVTNMRPDLFGGIVAEVPFVDSLTTMLDPTLPLTVHEYEEWGNPEDPEYYEYMKSYAPYENVKDAEYPSMLVTGGLNDPRVSYWEPAKWVQKLREHNTGPNTILLKTEMGAGHMGPSGRYDVWKDEAFVYAFMLKTLGKTKA